jgi:hypothetical protein
VYIYNKQPVKRTNREGPTKRPSTTLGTRLGSAVGDNMPDSSKPQEEEVAASQKNVKRKKKTRGSSSSQ